MQDTMTTKVMLKETYETSPLLELQARRAAKKAGLRAIKSRVRNLHSNNQGGWQILNPDRNEVVDGLNYEFTPERVIEFCAEYKAR